MHKSPCAFLSVLAVLLGMSGTCSFGYEFEVDGTMTVSPQHSKPFSCSMQVYVRDCEWAIFQVWENPTNRIITEVSDDGEYLYQLTRCETNHSPFMPDDLSHAVPNDWSGTMHPKDFLFSRANPEVIPLFYGYASSCYLDRHTDSMINFESPHPAGSFAVITRSFPPLRLPSRIIFRHELQYDTNAILAASGFTNIANLQVPLKVSLTRYLWNSANMGTAFEFQATRITANCSLKSFKPILPGRALITDYRNGQRASPQIANGWPVVRTE